MQQTRVQPDAGAEGDRGGGVQGKGHALSTSKGHHTVDLSVHTNFERFQWFHLGLVLGLENVRKHPHLKTPSNTKTNSPRAHFKLR